MKKVKITVLETTLNRALAEEYGVEGLKACPMMKQGQVFYADYANRKASATRPGKPSISTSLPWLTGRAATCFITGTGFANPAWLLSAVMTDCARCCLSWKPPISKPSSTIPRWIAAGRIEPVPVRLKFPQ